MTRLIVFDFDQTLSVVHVFKSLAGWDGECDGGVDWSVPPPFATSEKGQMRRIAELSENEFHACGGFASAAFGGKARVEQVRQLLVGLQDEGIELVICSKGLVGAVQYCLRDLDLSQYFSGVYGRVGDKYGQTDYDLAIDAGCLPAGDFELLGRAEQSEWKSKRSLIAELMRDRGLTLDQCVLVDDDLSETMRAANTCRTLLIEEAAGITGAHVTALLQLARPPHETPFALQVNGVDGCRIRGMDENISFLSHSLDINSEVCGDTQPYSPSSSGMSESPRAFGSQVTCWKDCLAEQFQFDQRLFDAAEFIPIQALCITTRRGSDESRLLLGNLDCGDMCTFSGEDSDTQTRSPSSSGMSGSPSAFGSQVGCWEDCSAEQHQFDQRLWEATECGPIQGSKTCCTALHIAVSDGQSHCEGASINAQTAPEVTGLHIASKVASLMIGDASKLCNVSGEGGNMQLLGGGKRQQFG
jgi:hypothetical protein